MISMLNIYKLFLWQRYLHFTRYFVIICNCNIPSTVTRVHSKLVKLKLHFFYLHFYFQNVTEAVYDLSWELLRQVATCHRGTRLPFIINHSKYAFLTWQKGLSIVEEIICNCVLLHRDACLHLLATFGSPSDSDILNGSRHVTNSGIRGILLKTPNGTFAWKTQTATLVLYPYSLHQQPKPTAQRSPLAILRFFWNLQTNGWFPLETSLSGACPANH